MYCTSAVGIHTRIKHTMVAIAGRKMGWDGQKRRYVCYSCMRDYLRPRGVLSACDLLAVGNDVEGTSCSFVDRSAFIMHK